ncbi:hypothetical protein RQP46_000872 [Phenoliferia psychrophenolica]
MSSPDSASSSDWFPTSPPTVTQAMFQGEVRSFFVDKPAALFPTSPESLPSTSNTHEEPPLPNPPRARTRSPRRLQLSGQPAAILNHWEPDNRRVPDVDDSASSWFGISQSPVWAVQPGSPSLAGFSDSDVSTPASQDATAAALRAEIARRECNRRKQAEKREKAAEDAGVPKKRKAVDKGAERRFPCLRCPAKFVRPSGLTTHELTHTKVKEHACPTCQQLFSIPSNLRRHLKIHLRPDNPPSPS